MSRYFKNNLNSDQHGFLREFRLPPRSGWELRSSGVFHSEK